MREYHPFYSDLVADFLLTLTKARQRKLIQTCNQPARNPFLESDYRFKDSDGRYIEHLMIEGFIIAYWVDHAVCQVMIVEVDNVR